jgi:hypothetical protein
VPAAMQMTTAGPQTSAAMSSSARMGGGMNAGGAETSETSDSSAGMQMPGMMTADEDGPADRGDRRRVSTGCSCS